MMTAERTDALTEAGRLLNRVVEYRAQLPARPITTIPYTVQRLCLLEDGRYEWRAAEKYNLVPTLDSVQPNRIVNVRPSERGIDLFIEALDGEGDGVKARDEDLRLALLAHVEANRITGEALRKLTIAFNVFALARRGVSVESYEIGF